MGRGFLALFILALGTLAGAQGQATKRVILSPKSNLDTGTISEGFSKYCPNVAVTENESKADYILEASNQTKFIDGDSVNRWHFTLLSKDGDVLMTTHPEAHLGNRFKHHFVSVCKFINAK